VSQSQDLAAFAFKETTISVGEVLRGALFRGELSAHAARVAWETACEEHAERLGMEADDEAVETMIERYRYERDLISAEETEAWLDSRGASVDDLQAHVTRDYWWETLKDEIGPVAAPSPGEIPWILELLETEVLMSDAFVPLAFEYGRRLIAREDSKEKPDPRLILAERTAFLERTLLGEPSLPGWLGLLGRSDAWLDDMLKLEASYRLRCEAILTPQRLAGELAAVRLPLSRLELEQIEFDSLDAAREAQLCVRDDGLSLQEVARESRYPFRRFELLAEDLPEDRRQKLLCAAIGEIQPPLESEGLFYLTSVMKKDEPTLAEPAIKRRIEQRIVSAHFSEACSKRLRWLIS
jgi:hypothetical protein